MTYIVALIFLLGILIFIHELGHFAVAKWSGVGVEVFSLGFGPKIFGIQKGETMYQLSLVPLGGYVKMMGEEITDEVSEAEIEKSFTHKPLYKRCLIVLAGPVMNLILAFVIFTLVFMSGMKELPEGVKTGIVGYVAVESPAEKAGLLKGDIVKSINGVSTDNWNKAYIEIILNPDKAVSMEIVRNGSPKTLTITPIVTEYSDGAGVGGFAPIAESMFSQILDDSPAERAGFQVEDKLISIDGVGVTHEMHARELMVEGGGGVRTFVIERDGQVMTLTATPEYDEERKGHLFGVHLDTAYAWKSYGFVTSMGMAGTEMIEKTKLLFKVIKKLFVGDLSVKTLGGPVKIAEFAGDAVKRSFTEYFLIMAFLSLQLGIINLFPIPVLDGGHLFIFIIEAIKGSPINEKGLLVAQQVGMVLLMSLMAVVIFNDVMHLVKKFL